MLWELFVLGSLTFDILLVASLVIAFASIERNPSTVTVTFLVTIAVMVLFTDWRPLSWIAYHFDLLVAMVIAYFVVGTGWAWLKWRFYIKKLGRIAREVKSKIFERHNIEIGSTVIPPEVFRDLKNELETRIENKYGVDVAEYNSKLLAPKVSKHKGMIIAWMSWWPISFIWTMINDPVVHLFTSIYYGIAESLQRMSDREFESITVVKSVDRT